MRYRHCAAVFLVSALVGARADEAQLQGAAPGLAISADGRSLVVRFSKPPVTRLIEVISACGMPIVGAPLIHSYALHGDTVTVAFGKHCQATLHIPDLKLSCDGCD